MRAETLTRAIEGVAPPEWAASWDTVGWQIGDPAREVSAVLVALDATIATAREALALGANLLVTHHPLIFRPISRIDPTTPQGELITFLIREGIAVWSAHTNLDRSRSGTSWALAEALGLQQLEFLETLTRRDGEPESGWGAVGDLPNALTTDDFRRHVLERLDAPDARVVEGRAERIRRVAVLGGSGSGWIPQAARTADAFVTSDVRYHQAQEAGALGLTLVDVSHYYSERPLLARIAELLSRVATVPVQIAGTVTCPFSPIEEGR